MEYLKKWTGNALLSVLILAASFGISLMIQTIFHTDTLIPTIFVLAVFLIAMTVDGYVIPILASLFSVLAVTFAFTFPYFTFDLMMPESVVSAVIMLIITILTSTLTTKVKKERKIRAEGEKEKVRANLLRAVSHDLRTPLTSVLGYLDIVNTHSDLTAEQKKKYVEIAYIKALRLQGMIEDLFSFTKLTYGGMPLKKSALDIVKLLQQEIEEFYPNFEENSLTCQFKSDRSSYIVLADGALIARAFENLIGNAIKYGSSGKIIRILISGTDERVKVSVINYGNVIPKEDLPHIFDKFFRVDQSRQVETGGTGLGLSIAKAIVEAHHGTITAQSSLAGTIFEVTLDLISEKG